MAKRTSGAAAALVEREKQAQAFVNGGTLLGDDDAEQRNPVEIEKVKQATAKPATSAVRTRKQLHSEKEDKSHAYKKEKERPKEGIVVEHRALRRALSKSRVQKTIRIPPMLMLEYEELCHKLEIDVDFNNHINEALVHWVERKRR